MLNRKPVSVLIDEIKNDYWLARSRAAEALGELGPDAKQAAPALRNALHDSHREVGRDAAEALMRIGPDASPAVPKLVSLLDHPDLGSYAHRALVAIGEPAVSALISVLSHPDRGFHAEIVLKAIGDPAIPHLIQALDLENESVRSKVISVISSIAPLGNEEAIEAMAQLVKSAEESRLHRFLAASALEKIDPAAAAELGITGKYKRYLGPR